ncbi:MAG: ABC transporter ATP-binding protein [Chrysiogenales bacterium]|nr:ABC transporter ATP-binding protein [Candidatus Aminicenantes bacterium]TFG80501.1 MAG: ABC transporter ATP-binding protein [Chrysiogenales bacterium]
MDTRFCLRAVGKTYRNRRTGRSSVQALTGVELNIKERCVNAIVGRSAAGKSTLARIIMGFEKPDHGLVLYRGRPLAEAPLQIFRCHNQMVFQNPYLAVNPLFTVRQIICEPLRVAGANPAACFEKLTEVLELLELPVEYLERLPHELSGGELQRVALARALVLEPEFLVLDEPFSALDDLTAMRILLQFKKIFLRLRLGILFVSHHPRHVQALADRVAVLEQGKIISQ